MWQGSSNTTFPKSLSHGSISPALPSKQLPSKSFASNYSIAEIQDEHIRLYARYKIEKDIRSVQRGNIRDPEAEKDVLSSIEEEFFQYRDPAECEDFVANKLPETLDLDFIISEKNRLKKQLAIVSRKVTDLMTRHQSAYFNELQRVIKLQHTVNDCINTCAKARSSLGSAKNNLTVRSLKIVTDCKRRENLTQFLNHLTADGGRLMGQADGTEVLPESRNHGEDESERYETPESSSPVKNLTPHGGVANCVVLNETPVSCSDVH